MLNQITNIERRRVLPRTLPLVTRIPGRLEFRSAANRDDRLTGFCTSLFGKESSSIHLGGLKKPVIPMELLHRRMWHEITFSSKVAIANAASRPSSRRAEMSSLCGPLTMSHIIGEFRTNYGGVALFLQGLAENGGHRVVSLCD